MRGHAAAWRAATRIRHRRRWPWVAAAAAAAAVAALAAASWLVLRLIGAARETRATATAARADLERSGRALRAGDEVGARRAAGAAERDLARADAAAGRRPVRVAARLPLVSSPVTDLGHLLAAAHILTGAREQAVTAQVRLACGRASVFYDGRIDLAGVATATDEATAVLDEFGRARTELNRVHGGWLAPGATPPAMPPCGGSTRSRASFARSSRRSRYCRRRSAPPDPNLSAGHLELVRAEGMGRRRWR